MKTTIQRIIEIPIDELQNEDAKENWGQYQKRNFKPIEKK